MSSKMSGSDTESTEDGEISWEEYTKYKAHKDATRFFKLLGYKDINHETWKPQEEPKMVVFTVGRETKTAATSSNSATPSGSRLGAVPWAPAPQSTTPTFTSAYWK